ncbi:cell division cycle 123 [Fusarium subglutinans]|uniref:Cell division cycle 123 n=1 Tax=Gibberella subglutinans TaxID=42677 RepID=A0A8H5PI72_GIBSU|nr:cell division cycle 123 [Fusarium subglutinans]KAF5596939.1 cell division cycle 123 [Fusarium subglutinans]
MGGNTTGNMHLTQTNYEDVESNCQNVPPTQFNTCFHTVEEILAHESTNHLSRPSEAPYSFKRWLPLILKTRNLDAKAAQVVKLTRGEARLLVAASRTSIITGEHNRAYQEDIQEEIIPHLSSLDFPTEGLFMRLDRCSPKDGRQAVPDPDDEQDQLLLNQGLSFDVFYDETDETVQLVELNVFVPSHKLG